MGNNIFEKLTEKYPFITLCVYANAEYVGVVQNRDDAVTTIYDFGSILSQEDKMKYLALATTWWWESNRKIPINIFLKTEMQVFRPFIKTFNSKDAELIFGPTVNLSEIAEKRIKRKSIQLVRSVKSNHS